MVQKKIVLGAQYGDEGKGKLVDYLVDQNERKSRAKLVVRFNGGSNAGHTVKINGVKYFTHVLPSGLLSPTTMNIMGNGMVISIESLFSELADMKSKGINYDGRLLISDRAHVTFGVHKFIDSNNGKKIGTTGQGIGPTYSDKAKRIGVRMGQLVRPDWKKVVLNAYQRILSTGCVEEQEYKKLLQQDLALIETHHKFLRDCVCNTTVILDAFMKDSNVVFEGANAAMLDLDFGTYPFVTSSICNIQGAFSGTGLDPAKFYTAKGGYEIVGVVKSYITRVGNGCLPTQFDEKLDMLISKEGGEFGVTTGRRRRCGALDLPQLKYVASLNGYTHLNMTKTDVLSILDTVPICTKYVNSTGEEIVCFPADEHELSTIKPVYKIFDGWKGYDMTTAKTYDDLHVNVKKYFEFIEQELGIPIKYINTGAGRKEMIVRDVDVDVKTSIDPMSSLIMSPLDSRYRDKVEDLYKYFTEFAYVEKRIQVELLYMEKLISTLGLDITFPPEIFNVSHDDYKVVKEIEKTTKHDVKAIEYFIRKHIRKYISDANYDNLIHIGLTSQDINSVAFSHNFLCAKGYMTSLITDVDSSILALSMRCSNVTLLGRTHAQPAVPMKFTQFYNMYLDRISKIRNKIVASVVSAKFGGAVGNHAALKFTYPKIDWDKFSKEFVESFTLVRTVFTSQIDSYDSICSILDLFKSLLVVLRDFIKNIEVYMTMGYFDQKMNASETGSSVMPQKVNPRELENALGHISLAIGTINAYTTDLPDSLLQRDLKDSCMLRYMGNLFGMMAVAMKYIIKGIDKLSPNIDVIKKDLSNRYEVVTEGIQTQLRALGVKDSYEKLKGISRGKGNMEHSNIIKLIDSLEIDEKSKEKMRNLTPDNYIE
jgi:adenylosuccinate synthase